MEKKERRKPGVSELLPYGRSVELGYGNPNRVTPIENSLCKDCMFSKWMCKNNYNREVRVPMESDDPPEIEIRTMRLKGYRMNELIYERTGYKLVDGVEYGIYKSDDDIPDAEICGWYEPNTWFPSS